MPKKQKKSQEYIPDSFKKAKRKEAMSGPMVLIKVFLYLLCAVVVVVQGMDRVAAANELVGSTAFAIRSNTDRTVPENDPSEETGASENEGDTEKGANSSFKYIPASVLQGMSDTELGVWYLQQFPDEASTNASAKKEFEAWFKSEVEAGTRSQTSFDETLEYLADHPEIVNPPAPEKKSEDEEGDASATGETASQTTEQTPTTVVPTAPTQGGTPNTGTVAPTGGQGTAAGADASTTTKRSKIDEALLNKSTAAEVANWAYRTFTPGKNWDYTALSEFYDWLDEKGLSDAAFKTNVMTYLDIMGWSE